MFGFLGNFTGLKNPTVLYNAFSKLNGDVKLKIWGNGLPAELQALNQFCATEKRAEYLGTYTPEQLADILSQVDVVVLPSKIESYSLVAREALMAQTPVIAAAVGGILDVVNDGENGWLFNPFDENQLKQIMQNLVDDPQLVQGAAAVETKIMTLDEDVAFWAGYYPKTETKMVAQNGPQNQTNSLPRITVLSSEQYNRACPYIRLHKSLTNLQGAGHIDYRFIHLENAGNLEARLDETDILIIQRNVPGQIPYETLKPYIEKNNIKMVYEFDDAFWTIPKGHLAYDYYAKMRPQLEKYLRQADLVTVSTKAIEKYVLGLNENVQIIPNVLDEQLWQAKEPELHDGPVRILFSGTPTHLKDLAIILKPLEKILKEYKDKVELVLWGNELVELTKLPNVKRGPEFTSVYADYAQQLQNLEIDFALVPLEESPFNNAKSDIKWLEYSRSGIAGVYSNVAAYKDTLVDKENGLLANNTNKAWYRAIKWMIEHPNERMKMAQNAKKEIAEKYLLKNNLNNWLEAYNQLVKFVAPTDVQPKHSYEVSIIIPLYNKVEYTRKCFDALEENTQGINYEIVFVDNASTDGTADFISGLANKKDNIQIIRNKENIGFSRANNQALKQAKGEWVVFLNNDTEPRAHWLEAMLAIAKNDGFVGAVGAKLLYPDETIQHAGVAIVEDLKNGDPLLGQHILSGRPKDFPQANLMIEFQAVTAACMLMPKFLADELNGFDEGYFNGYEDVDLCFRIREEGYKIIYQPHAELIHHESKSGPERFVKVAENIQRLHTRWLGKIQPDFRLEQSGEAVQLSSPINFYAPPETGQTVLDEHAETTPQSQGESRPLASIVMLTFNALGMTKKTIDSIVDNTDWPYELILVDNGSTDGTIDWLKKLDKKLDNVRLILNKENKGFSAGNNQGVAIASGEYICLLNNDVLVGDGWLEDLISAFDRDEKIGMVSALTNNASGFQLLENVPYSDDEGFFPFAKSWRKQHRGQVTPRRRLAGFVLLTSKNIFNEIDGFDEIYGLGNYEDDDISLKIRQAGYALMVHDGTYIHHFGSSSFKANNIDLLASLRENEKIFKKKWPDVDYQELLEMKNPLHDLHPKMIDEATAVFEQGDAEQAAEIFSEILAVNPLSGEALLGITLAYRSLGENGQAAQYLQRAYQHFPDNAAVLNQMGLMAFMEGNKEEALTYFEQALNLDGSFLDVKRNYGQALIENEQYEKGVNIFVEILDSNPEDIGSIVYMAELYAEIGQIDKANSFATKALELDPQNEIAQAILGQPGQDISQTQSTDLYQKVNDEGFALLDVYKIDEAQEKFQQSFDLFENADALFGTALCAFQKNQEIKTVNTLNRLIENGRITQLPIINSGWSIIEMANLRMPKDFLPRPSRKTLHYLKPSVIMV